MRGEHISNDRKVISSKGSSPHARGAHRLRCERLSVQGIIPACAGSTADKVTEQVKSEDHPRMRGEHRTEFVPVNVYEGSSPHARGALIVCRYHRDGCGIIPACAGSTNKVNKL